jgi:hypothetical protein
MTQDIHAMWRTIGDDWLVMKEQAPEGHEPVVTVHLLGSSEAIPVGRVETHRGHGLVMLHVITEGIDSPDPHRSDRVVYVLHDRISHAEIGYQRTAARGIGFTVSEAEEQLPPSSV